MMLDTDMALVYTNNGKPLSSLNPSCCAWLTGRFLDDAITGK